MTILKLNLMRIRRLPQRLLNLYPSKARALFFLLTLLALFFAVDYFGVFNISTIEIRGSERYVKNEDVSLMLKSEKGKNIFMLDKDDLANKLKGNFLALGEISIEKHYPNTLLVDLSERSGIAVIVNPSGFDGYFVDEDGFILGFTPNNGGYPKINFEGVDKISVGSFIEDKKLLKVLEIINLLEDGSLRVYDATASRNFLKLSVDGIDVYFSLESDNTMQVDLVEKIIRKYNLEGRYLKKIDLRFKDPVIELYDREEK